MSGIKDFSSFMMKVGLQILALAHLAALYGFFKFAYSLLTGHVNLILHNHTTLDNLTMESERF